MMKAFVAAALMLLACGSTPGGTNDGNKGSSGGASSGGGWDPPGETPGTPSWDSEPKQGIATFYDATGEGACSFDALPAPLRVVALDTATYAEAALCGACVDVEGPKGTVHVRVVDLCPDCQSPHLDLSAEAFAEIADPIDGRVPVTFRFVACATQNNLRYRYKEGSSRWWTGIQILNHRLPIAKLEFQNEGTWQEIPRTVYNYFVREDGVGLQPGGLRLRITAIDGQTHEETLPAIGEDPLDTNVHEGTGQFE